MRLRRGVYSVAIAIFVTWNLATYYFFYFVRNSGHGDSKDGAHRAESGPLSAGVAGGGLARRLTELETALQEQMEENKALLKLLQNSKVEKGREAEKNVELQPAAPRANSQTYTHPPDAIAVLVIACDRPTVSRCLDQLIRYRPSPAQFPIIVSQDCQHGPTRDIIQKYSGHLAAHLHQPDTSTPSVATPKEKKLIGYYKIARHYGWALNKTFMDMGYKTALIVEDDLDIAPDFFDYFLATSKILHEDPTLWCVSAWNDNGKQGFVQDAPDLLYRTDFFPGLGWMLEHNTWLELMTKWPPTFWDDWMRKPEQRHDRACIRPEISRTKTFGEKGVSKGQFYKKHLQFIQLNSKPVPFTHMDLDYLRKENYDPMFVRKVFSVRAVSLVELTTGAVKAGRDVQEVRVEYSTKEQYVKIAKALGAMEDLKAGVPRQAYRGVVPVIYRGLRVYIAPPPTWKAYNPAW